MELLSRAGPLQGSGIWSTAAAGSRDEIQSPEPAPGAVDAVGGMRPARSSRLQVTNNGLSSHFYWEIKINKSKTEQKLLFPLQDVSFLPAPEPLCCLQTRLSRAGLCPSLGNFSISVFAQEKVRKEAAAASKGKETR